MKFILQTDSEKVMALCAEYNFCTKMNCAEYDKMLNSINDCTFDMYDADDIKEYTHAIEKTAKLIYSHSNVNDISLEDIASMLFNRCTLRWVE